MMIYKLQADVLSDATVQLRLFIPRSWDFDAKEPWHSGMNESTLETETGERPLLVSGISLVPGHCSRVGLGL